MLFCKRAVALSNGRDISLQQADVAELCQEPSSRSKNLGDCSDSEAPPVGDNIVAGFKTLLLPMDTTKLQLLINKQSLTCDKKYSSNTGLQVSKYFSSPQDCSNPDFSTNLEKLRQLSTTDATHSTCSNFFESSLLSAIEELFNVFSKEQIATTNANNKLQFGVDAPVFSESLSSEEDSKAIFELLKNKASKGTRLTKNKKI